MIVCYNSKSLHFRIEYFLFIISADKAQSPDYKKLIRPEHGQWKNLETREIVRAWKSTQSAWKDGSLIDHWFLVWKAEERDLSEAITWNKCTKFILWIGWDFVLLINLSKIKKK